jgi:hypothetical protein
VLLSVPTSLAKYISNIGLLIGEVVSIDYKLAYNLDFLAFKCWFLSISKG